MKKFLCDQCGVALKQKELVMLVMGSPDKNPFAPDASDEYAGRFELCRECAMALLVALKSTKSTIRKGERPVKM